jgi:hypothetical protein
MQLFFAYYFIIKRLHRSDSTFVRLIESRYPEWQDLFGEVIKETKIPAYDMQGQAASHKSAAKFSNCLFRHKLPAIAVVA